MYIDKIFVISLEHRLDERFKRIYREITDQGLGHLVTLVIGTNGKDLPPSVASKTTGWYFGPGERGCFESHRHCWRQILALDDCSNALILEDDADCTDLASVLKDIEDMMSFDSYNIGAFDNKNMKQTRYGTFVADAAYPQGESGAWGCAAYTCNQKAAREYLEGSCTSFPVHVDWYTVTHPVIQQHVAVPPLINIHWDGISDSALE